MWLDRPFSPRSSLIASSHILAPRGHAGQPGPRAENRARDLGASRKCSHLVPFCATAEGSPPPGQKTRRATALAQGTSVAGWARVKPGRKHRNPSRFSLARGSLKKMGHRRLGAGPRGPTSLWCRRNPMGRGVRLERQPGDVRCTANDTDGLEPAAFAGPGGSGDSAEWRNVAAIAERRPGTRDCNSEPGDGWDERASRSP